MQGRLPADERHRQVAPRAARAHGADAFAALLDNVVGGGATFTKFKEGLPAWPAAEAAEEEEGDGDEYDL